MFARVGSNPAVVDCFLSVAHFSALLVVRNKLRRFAHCRVVAVVPSPLLLIARRWRVDDFAVISAKTRVNSII